MARNPFSFLHIINPGYKYHQEISGQQRFTLVKNRYQEFKDDKEASTVVRRELEKELMHKTQDSFMQTSSI